MYPSCIQAISKLYSSCIQPVSKPYPSCIPIVSVYFSTKQVAKKRRKFKKWTIKGQYHAITYTKIKQVYAQKDNTVHQFKPNYNIPPKDQIYAHNPKVVGVSTAVSNHSYHGTQKGSLIFFVQGKRGERSAEVVYNLVRRVKYWIQKHMEHVKWRRINCQTECNILNLLKFQYIRIKYY